MRGTRPGLIIIAAVFTVGTAWAHGGASGVVKERMDAMSEIGANMKTIGKTLKAGGPVERNKISAAAGIVASHGGKELTNLFPEGSLHEPTEASPEIWREWSRFSEYAGSLRSSALELKELTEAGADRQQLGAAFGSLAKSCKSCHEAFRIKK
ncbi:cytochrome c [Rhodobacterales bacterium]|nr:cytochrome c [Rhodobacterales bacterium]